jgi:hypothetical protein
LDITQGSVGKPGVLMHTAWRSFEIVSGGIPCWIAGSATVKSEMPRRRRRLSSRG